jgi:glycosyltransferase involved in cell wall biosynthesis
MSESRILDIMHIASGDLWAGAEVQLFTLALALKRTQQVNLVVILLNHGKLEQQLQENGIRVIVIDESRLNGLQILRRLMKCMHEFNPDVVHTHRFKENILGSIAAFFSGRIAGIRTVHGAAEQDVSWRQFIKKTVMAVDRFCGTFLQQKIIAVSDELAAKLAAALPEKKIHVIENGIDFSDVKSMHNPDRATAYFKFGIAGRLVPIKRVDLFIRSARYLLDHYPDFNASYHIFGDGPLMADLQAFSSELGTENIVHFEGHCNEMDKALNEIDILVMTSDHEGLPMILLEAMASCVPIIAHATGGIPKLLRNGTCGILIYEHKPSAYANAMHQLATSPAERKQLASQAFLHARSHYSSNQNAMAYLAEYRQLSTSRTGSKGTMDNES